MHRWELIVIGAGAAGMMAAVAAAENGLPGGGILVLERNEKPGKKIYITGKGRCNLTNACEIEELFLNVPRQAKFLYSAFYTFSNAQTIEFFERAGMRTKVERGNRVFPVSDHASDVIGALKRRMNQLDIQNAFPVKEINISMPSWINSLDKGHWLKEAVFGHIKDAARCVTNLREISDCAEIGRASCRERV